MRGTIVLVGSLLVAACAASGGDVPRAAVVADQRGRLDPVDGSGVSGDALARTGRGQTGISLTVAGARPGAQHPWHIHRGTCGSSGAIVGDAAAYPVLQVGSDGRASASASVPVELAAGQQFYVNVHRSPADLGTIVACGPLGR